MKVEDKSTGMARSQDRASSLGEIDRGPETEDRGKGEEDPAKHAKGRESGEGTHCGCAPGTIIETIPVRLVPMVGMREDRGLMVDEAIVKRIVQGETIPKEELRQAVREGRIQVFEIV